MELLGGTYTTNSSQYFKTIAGNAGGRFLVIAQSAATANVFNFDITGIAGAADSADGFATVGGIAQNGAWTLGPAAGVGNQYSSVHRFNGGITFFPPNIGSSASPNFNFSSSPRLMLGWNRTDGGQEVAFVKDGSSGATEAFHFYNATSNTATTFLGGVSAAGAWTLGAPSALSSAHIVQNNFDSASVQTGSAVATMLLRNANYTPGTSTTGDVRLGFGFGTQTQGTAYIGGRRVAFNQVAVVVNTEFGNNNSAAGVILSPNTTTWAAQSDARLKKNILNLEYGLSEILALRSVRFDYIADGSEASARIGFIAQEAALHIPEAVSGSEESMYNLAATEIIPVLVKAIQELAARLAALEGAP